MHSFDFSHAFFSLRFLGAGLTSSFIQSAISRKILKEVLLQALDQVSWLQSFQHLLMVWILILKEFWYQCQILFQSYKKTQDHPHNLNILRPILMLLIFQLPGKLFSLGPQFRLCFVNSSDSSMCKNAHGNNKSRCKVWIGTLFPSG